MDTESFVFPGYVCMSAKVDEEGFLNMKLIKKGEIMSIDDRIKSILKKAEKLGVLGTEIDGFVIELFPDFLDETLCSFESELSAIEADQAVE